MGHGTNGFQDKKLKNFETSRGPKNLVLRVALWYSHVNHLTRITHRISIAISSETIRKMGKKPDTEFAQYCTVLSTYSHGILLIDLMVNIAFHSVYPADARHRLRLHTGLTTKFR